MEMLPFALSDSRPSLSRVERCRWARRCNCHDSMTTWLTVLSMALARAGRGAICMCSGHFVECVLRCGAVQCSVEQCSAELNRA